MTHEEMVSQLSLQLTRVGGSPLEIVYAISMQNVIAEIVRRLGEKALTLTAPDLQLAREEVQAAIAHHLDEQEFIGIGLDVWEITRSL